MVGAGFDWLYPVLLDNESSAQHMKHSDTQHPREKSTLVYVDKILPIQRTPKRVRCTCVSMDVHAYILVRMISYLRYECGCVCVCFCVRVCTQASEVPLVMHSEICPAAVPPNSCSLLKGSLSSSAPIPLKTNLSASVCFPFLSPYLISCHAYVPSSIFMREYTWSRTWLRLSDLITL